MSAVTIRSYHPSRRLWSKLSHSENTPHTSQSQLPRDLNDKLAGNTPSLKPKKNDFKVYSSVRYPLYYTALICRCKPLRQSALAMLRYADFESVWDADMLAIIAEFVIAIEEHSIRPDSHNVCADAPHFWVPETSRIHFLSLNIVEAQRTVWLR